MTLEWIHKKMSNLYCVMPLVLLIGFASFASSPGNLSNRLDYSEEDIFKSIFFADGDLAESIPQLHQFNIRNFTTDPSEINKATQQQQQIFNAVKSMQPNYMASLKNAIASGNHLTIQNALQEGASYVNEATAMLNPEIDDELKSELAADFSSHVDVNNASPEELKQAIDDYVSSGGNNPLAVVACIALLLIVLVVFVLVIPLLVAGSEMEATLANEIIVNELANSGR